MAKFLTVDGGTTNTRVYLVIDKKVIDAVKINIGAKKSIEGNTPLKEALKKAIEELLLKHSLCSSDISCIPTSGMITSEFGLINLPHITAPAGIAEFHSCSKRIVLPEICDIPFLFIPGVKTASSKLEETDMMRGEETELYGLSLYPQINSVYILPGSHSKLIKTDEKGRISTFKTMLTGEMIAALSQDTILRDAVDLTVDSADDDFLLRGFDYAVTHGLNEALFKVRVLKKLFGAEKVQVYSFFLGAVLSAEIMSLKGEKCLRVIIGGKPQLRNAMITIISNRLSADVIDAGDASDFATAIGAVNIAEYPN